MVVHLLDASGLTRIGCANFVQSHFYVDDVLVFGFASTQWPKRHFDLAQILQVPVPPRQSQSDVVPAEADTNTRFYFIVANLLCDQSVTRVATIRAQIFLYTCLN